MNKYKVCFKCNLEKELSEFYKHKNMPDGHVNKCKECNKIDVKENRINNIEYYREYDKNRASNPERLEAKKNYQQTEAGKLAANKAKNKWKENNLIKRAASHMVNNAVRYGKLEKKYYCEVCNITDVRIHGHHDDYAFPLNVRWLCPKCHNAWHKENGSAKNG